MTLTAFGVVMDLIMLILRIIDKEAGLISLILFFVLLALTAAGVFVYNHINARRMKAFFDREDDNLDGTEEELFDRFDELRLSASARQALFYLDYAVAHHYMHFYAFPFMKYIHCHFHQTPVIAHCTRVISWLPYSTRPLNFLCTQAISRRDLGIQERFVLFQLERIRMLRESSASSTAAEKLTSMKTYSMETASMMRAFWERSDCSIALLNRFARQLAGGDSLWTEAIEDFPNSVPFRSLYISYLVDGATRFSDAVFQKTRADMIENGTDFRVDNCFRRFVRTFPDYLKRAIVDLKGNPVKREGSKGTRTLNSSGNEMSGGVLDAVVEEGIGKSIFSQARVRLTVERAFMGRRPNAFVGLVYATIAVLLVSVGTFIFVKVYFSTYFDARGDVADRIALQNFARFYTMATIYSWLYYWGTAPGIEVLSVDFLPILEQEDAGHAEEPFFPAELRWEDRAMWYNVEGRTAYDDLLVSVMDMAADGIDIFRYAQQLFNSSAIAVRFCTQEGLITDTWWRGNMRTVWSYFLVQTSLFNQNQKPEEWFTEGNEAVCIILSSMPASIQSLSELRQALSSMADVSAQEAGELLSPLMVILPCCLFGFSVLVFGLASALYIREVNRFTLLLLDLPKSLKRECQKPMRCDALCDEITSSNGSTVLSPPHYNLPAIFHAIILIVLAGYSVVLFVQISNINDYNDLYAYLNNWIVWARCRKTYVIETAIGAIFAILDHNPKTDYHAGNEWNYVDVASMTRMSTDGVARIIQVNEQLLERTDDGSPSTVGFDSEIDSLTLTVNCDSNPDSRSRHESYRCSSGLQLMQWHVNTIQEVILDPKIYNGEVDSNTRIGQLVHLIDRHLLPILLRIDDRFGDLNSVFKSDFLASHDLFFGIELGLTAIMAIIVIVYCWTVNSCYDVLLTLLRRIPPVHILNHEPLEVYLLNKSGGKRRTGLTADERIIDVCADCIICMGSSGIIDLINPSVTRTFGYTPEQLLGQRLTSLLTNDHADKVSTQMRLMAERQSVGTFEGHTTCLADDETEIPCSLSLLAIFDGDEISSFVAILRDESLILEQQQESELAKRQSETLLFQILPRNIVTRINAGEKDISFSVPSATIIFIDIVKFSEYALNLTPQAIMGNLSLIFGTFDDACVTHPMLLKIKLIGDVYMAAGGIFDYSAPPAAHAEQTVRFALEALEIIDEVNVKLTSALAVRIGINTGGPILAGVLGSDKPAFDIIGDPINVAARLQSTSLPSRIQISADTHALIAGMDFAMDYRGEIDLKGKGKRKTFFVDGLKDVADGVGMSTSTLEDFARFIPETSVGS